MKVFSPALAAHYALGSNTMAHGLKITREDSEVFAYTSHDVSDEIDGVTYEAEGLDVSNIVIQTGLAVGNLELTALDDGTIFTKADILGGQWRNAAFTLIHYNYEDLSGGVNTLLAGTIGEVQMLQNKITAELLDLRQYVQQEVVRVTSFNCTYRLFSTDKNRGGLCRVDPVPYTYPGSVTSVDSNAEFSDTAAVQVSDFFGAGSVEWLTGLNAGRFAKITVFESGAFTLETPMIQEVQVGDTFIAVAGCRKRLIEDCVGKFSNGINHGGQPYMPSQDRVTKRNAVAV